MTGTAGAPVERDPVNPWIEERLVRLGPAGTILDLGCGRGWWLARMQALGLAAVGAESDALRAATAGTGGRAVVVADGQRLPFADRSLSLVWCVHVLHHLRAPAAALSEAHRVLRPGGHLVLAETVEDHPAIRMARRVHPEWDGVGVASRFDATGCRDMVAAAGFDVIEYRQHSLLSFAAWALPFGRRRAWSALSDIEERLADRWPAAARARRFGAHLELVAARPASMPTSPAAAAP